MVPVMRVINNIYVLSPRSSPRIKIIVDYDNTHLAISLIIVTHNSIVK